MIQCSFIAEVSRGPTASFYFISAFPFNFAMESSSLKKGQKSDLFLHRTTKIMFLYAEL